MHRHVVVAGTQVAHVGQAELGRQLLAIVQGLAEQHAGIQEQHRDRRVDLGGHVQQDRRLRPERGHQRQLVAIEVDGRLQDLLRRCQAQPRIQRPGFGRHIVHRLQQGAQLPVPRSTKAGWRSSAPRW